MCGISAYVGDGAGEAERAVERAFGSLRHRGPDGRGSYSREGVHLGQTRLQIVGSATAGAQPVRDERFAMVFNGEIHNYRELANTLAPSVAVESDTEVLFSLLRAKGTAVLPQLRGFWAFVFVDFERRTLIACRDRYGQKPLLYNYTAGRWAFASEAPALGTELRPLRAALEQFTADGHYPSAPATFYENVLQVRPGHVLTIDLTGAKSPAETSYYALPQRSISSRPPSFEEATSHFRLLLEQAYELRLRAGTPVGLALSAGKDSGTLAALSKVKRGHAFTFDSRAVDSEAAEVERWYGHRFRLSTTSISSDPDRYAERVAVLHQRLDAPLASGALLALDSIYTAARRQGVPVLLSGQGADEVLGGYNYYLALQRNRFYAKLARTSSVGGAVDLLHAYWDRRHARKLSNGIGGRPIHPSDDSSPGDALGDRQRYDLSGAPMQTMLWYEDRIAMASSVEARYPFLDVALVDFCLSLPSDYHVAGFTRKRLLQEAYAKTWPAELRAQRSKRGLPAAESRLLDNAPDWTADGLRLGLDYLGVRLGNAKSSGPRSAKTLFRFAALGHWLALH